MKREYKELMNCMEAPEGLRDRVLAAVREGRPAVKKSRQTLWRTAVCAACALLLVLGGVMPKPRSEAADQADALTHGFGLTAYAAEPGAEPMVPVNGGVAFGGGSGEYWSKKNGYYSGCIFRITGAGIQRVSIAVDKGEFYRLKALENMSAEERRALKNARESGMAMPDTLIGVEDGREVHQTLVRVGSQWEEDYDASVSYGFWFPAIKAADVPEGVTRPDTQASIDTIDGARLTVTVLYTNGEEQRKVYTLSSGKMKAVWNRDGTKSLLPGLTGDHEEFFYGVYAASEEDSFWLQWPVEGSNTVSLSSRYGYRTAPGGKGGTFHAGIDIPGEQGLSIIAAAGGTVLETGFDTTMGNYLLLDHGNGITTLYGQCRQVLVQTGDRVEAGEEIALLGSTGMSTGPHLHFEVRQDGEAQNPVAYFDSAVRDTLSMG